MTDWVEADYPTLTAGTRVKLTHPDGSVLYRKVEQSEYRNLYISLVPSAAISVNVLTASLKSDGWSVWVEAPTTPELPPVESIIGVADPGYPDRVWPFLRTGINGWVRAGEETYYDTIGMASIVASGFVVLEPRNVTAKAVWEALNAHREEHPNDSIKTAWAVIAAEFGVVG